MTKPVRPALTMDEAGLFNFPETLRLALGKYAPPPEEAVAIVEGMEFITLCRRVAEWSAWVPTVTTPVGRAVPLEEFEDLCADRLVPDGWGYFILRDPEAGDFRHETIAPTPGDLSPPAGTTHVLWFEG